MNFRDRGIEPIERLETDQMLLRPLRSTDAELDYEAVMESREFLRIWEQDTWPADDFTVEANVKDLEKHERDEESGVGYTYTVMTPDETECLGCVYTYSPTVNWIERDPKTPIGDHDWSSVDAVTMFWIRLSRLDEGMDRTLLDLLRQWMDDAWPFENHVFMTNEDFHQQVEMIEAAGLERRFYVGDVDKPGTFVVYA